MKDYEDKINKFDLYIESATEIVNNFSNRELINLLVFLLHYIGLTGEVGELGEKIKKRLRDHRLPIPRGLDEFAKEFGDIEWYVTRSETDLGFTKSEILKKNFDKLQSRWERKKLGGSGDNR